LLQTLQEGVGADIISVAVATIGSRSPQAAHLRVAFFDAVITCYLSLRIATSNLY